MKTKNILNIYWDSTLGDVDGQTFYLFSHDINYRLPDFPFELWPAFTEAKKHKLFGNNWIVWIWDVKYSDMPKLWVEITKETLHYFYQNNAVVSWCGLDGYFVEPPELFKPDKMSNGVYAAIGSDGIFICHTDLNTEYQAISDDELYKLNQMI